MSNTLKKTFVGAFVAAVALFGATSASALTQSELLAQALDAGWSFDQFNQAYQMAFGGSSNTGSTSCGTTYGYTATSTLKQGMSGAAVSALQSALNNYANASLSTDGSFGPATKAAVMAFQSSKGLSADGVAGPATQGALQTASMMTGSNCGNDNGSTGSNEISGDAGSVSSYELVSSYANEEVGEGESDVPVAGLRIEADNGSDLGITSIKLAFDHSGSGSEDLDDYVSEVTVWYNDEQVGSVDVDDFSESSSNVWSKTVSLDGVVIDADEDGDIIVAVSALDTIDSSDLNQDWTVDFQTVRFVDGQDVVTSEDAGTNAVTFDFQSFATAADVEMTVALADDNMDARIQEVDDSSDTDGVELLKFTVEADGSDITINDLPVLLTVTGATDVDFIANSLTLEVDGEEFSETVSTSSATVATITFDDIDFTVEEGDEVTFTVSADVNDLDSNFEAGDTIKAELTAPIVDTIDADDQQGDAITDADATGTALGEQVSFYETGIMVTDFSSDVTNYVDDGADDDTGEFEMSFKVTAFGGTVYIGKTASATVSSSIAESTLSSGAMLYMLTDSGTATTDDQATDIDFSEGDGADDNSNHIILEEGESTTITLLVTQTNNTAEDDGIYRAYLKAIMWNTTDSTSSYNVYDFNLEDFKTAALSLN